jgi:hypothetical protein
VDAATAAVAAASLDSSEDLIQIMPKTGLSVSQVTDEVLYTGLVEMQEMDELVE